jgi:hypothetical protein
LRKKIQKTHFFPDYLAPFFFGKKLSDNFCGLFSYQSMVLQLASAKNLEKKRLLRDTKKRLGLPLIKNVTIGPMFFSILIVNRFIIMYIKIVFST